MKQIRVHGANDVRLDDVDPPPSGPRDAVVAVSACGVCGSDLSFIHMGGLGGTHPMPLGHEMAGVVDWVGTEVEGVCKGDRVIVHPGDDSLGRIGCGGPEGGLAPSLLVREAVRGKRLFPVPDGMPLEVAAMAEPLGVGMQSVNRAEVSAGDKVAVFGCGPIGLMAIATLVDRGIHDIAAIDLSARRLDLAADLGADVALNPAEVDVWDELSRLHGTVPIMFGGTSPATDAFIEASGAGSVITDVIARCRPGAVLSVVGVHYQPIPVSFALVLMKQLSIHGSFEYPPRFEDGIELLARRDLSALITHRVPLDRFDDALALLDGSKDCGKVMISVGEGL